MKTKTISLDEALSWGCRAGLLAIVAFAVALKAEEPGAAEGAAPAERPEVDSRPNPSAVPGLVPRLEAFLKARQKRIDSLVESYLRALGTQFDLAADAGDLALATSIKEEREQVLALSKALANPPDDPVSAVAKPLSLPRLDDSASEDLAKLRKTWNDESSKIERQLRRSLGKSLQALESELTKVRMLEDAQVVLALRGSLEESATEDFPERPPREPPYENSLGMRFVPVSIAGGPTAGKRILFSVWETRVSDYAIYARRKGRDVDSRWKNVVQSDHEQEENHPVVMVNWEDANGFCEWLTDTERRTRKIGPNDRYRLPTDYEWSCAVGIGDEEDPGASPADKGRAGPRNFLWGTEWPPPERVGNLLGEDTSFRGPIEGYRDGYPFTAPVGSFPKDQLGGVFDLGGNVSEWCEDLLDPSSQSDRRVVRGGSWGKNLAIRFVLSYRYTDIKATQRVVDIGFRCVLERGDEGDKAFNPTE